MVGPIYECLKPPKRCCTFWDPESTTRMKTFESFLNMQRSRKSSYVQPSNALAKVQFPVEAPDRHQIGWSTSPNSESQTSDRRSATRSGRCRGVHASRKHSRTAWPGAARPADQPRGRSASSSRISKSSGTYREPPRWTRNPAAARREQQRTLSTAALQAAKSVFQRLDP